MGSRLVASELPEGKQWVSVSLDELAVTDRHRFSAAARPGGELVRSRACEYLQGLSGDVEKIGDDTVGGEHATHYRASIDYAKVADEVAEHRRPICAGKLAKLGTVPADVWIDDQDRVVKMHFTIDGSALGAGAGTAELHDGDHRVRGAGRRAGAAGRRDRRLSSRLRGQPA